MAQLQTGSESPGYSILEEDSSTHTTERDFCILEQTRDATTQTEEEEFIFSEPTREASTLTPEDGLNLLEQPSATTETSDESRKRKMSDEEEVTLGSDVSKVRRTETSGMSDEIVSSSSEAGCRVQRLYFYTTLCEMNSHSDSEHERPLTQQAPAETELRCFSCKKTTSEHVTVHDGTTKYTCCQCLLPSETFHYLQMHIYYEHKPSYCNVCQLRYSAPSSHVSGGICAACNLHFECKYQLEEHYILIHKDFLKTNCKICGRKLDDHLTSGEVMVEDKYECCVRECRSSFNKKQALDHHLCSHSSLKLFKCELCRDHFTSLYRHLNNVNIHPVCELCGKRFVNSYFLDEHLSDEHK